MLLGSITPDVQVAWIEMAGVVLAAAVTVGVPASLTILVRWRSEARERDELRALQDAETERQRAARDGTVVQWLSHIAAVQDATQRDVSELKADVAAVRVRVSHVEDVVA